MNALKLLKKAQKNQAKKNLKTVETWLPIFPGFYETGFDLSDFEIERVVEQEESEYIEYFSELHEAGIPQRYFNEHLWSYIDFSNCFKDAAESLCNHLKYLDNTGIINEVEFQKICSPKYYNFSNDSINCKITFNAKNLQEYINKNKESFKEYIEERYTSRSGFSSFYSNDVNNWMSVSDYGEHEVGSVLQFVLLNDSQKDELRLGYELLDLSNLHESFCNYEIDTKKMILDFKTRGGV